MLGAGAAGHPPGVPPSRSAAWLSGLLSAALLGLVLSQLACLPPEGEKQLGEACVRTTECRSGLVCAGGVCSLGGDAPTDAAMLDAGVLDALTLDASTDDAPPVEDAPADDAPSDDAPSDDAPDAP